MSTPTPSKARILCLHGYAQNAAFFRQRTGSLRKALKAVAGDFVFVDAPFAATAGFLGDINADERGQSLGWWTFDEATASRPSLSHEYAGVERSLELLDATCEREGPFDGVLGFSQGAALAALLCMRRRTLFRFAILVAGTRRPSETLP